MKQKMLLKIIGLMRKDLDGTDEFITKIEEILG
jgi:putative N-acetylmannosamine-6-phosphate epimerase